MLNKIQNIQAKKYSTGALKCYSLELNILKKVFIAYDVTTHNHNHNLCTLLQQLTAHLTEGRGGRHDTLMYTHSYKSIRVFAVLWWTVVGCGGRVTLTGGDISASEDSW